MNILVFSLSKLFQEIFLPINVISSQPSKQNMDLSESSSKRDNGVYDHWDFTKKIVPRWIVTKFIQDKKHSILECCVRASRTSEILYYACRSGESWDKIEGLYQHLSDRYKAKYPSRFNIVLNVSSLLEPRAPVSTYELEHPGSMPLTEWATHPGWLFFNNLLDSSGLGQHLAFDAESLVKYVQYAVRFKEYPLRTPAEVWERLWDKGFLMQKKSVQEAALCAKSIPLLNESPDQSRVRNLDTGETALYSAIVSNNPDLAYSILKSIGTLIPISSRIAHMLRESAVAALRMQNTNSEALFKSIVSMLPPEHINSHENGLLSQVMALRDENDSPIQNLSLYVTALIEQRGVCFDLVKNGVAFARFLETNYNQATEKERNQMIHLSLKTMVTPLQWSKKLFMVFRDYIHKSRSIPTPIYLRDMLAMCLKDVPCNKIRLNQMIQLLNDSAEYCPQIIELIKLHNNLGLVVGFLTKNYDRLQISEASLEKWESIFSDGAYMQSYRHVCDWLTILSKNVEARVLEPEENLERYLKVLQHIIIDCYHPGPWTRNIRMTSRYELINAHIQDLKKNYPNPACQQLLSNAEGLVNKQIQGLRAGRGKSYCGSIMANSAQSPVVQKHTNHKKH